MYISMLMGIVLYSTVEPPLIKDTLKWRTTSIQRTLVPQTSEENTTSIQRTLFSQIHFASPPKEEDNFVNLTNFKCLYSAITLPPVQVCCEWLWKVSLYLLTSESVHEGSQRACQHLEEGVPDRVAMWATQCCVLQNVRHTCAVLRSGPETDTADGNETAEICSYRPLYILTITLPLIDTAIDINWQIILVSQ